MVFICFHLIGPQILCCVDILCRKRVNRKLTANSLSTLATMMDTELPEAPITPTTLSGLGMMGGSPFEQRTSELSFWMRAWTKVSDCSRAYVSLEQVSRIRAPKVMLGSKSGSLLIWSKAYSMASSRWIPFSFLTSPQGTPAGPRECTGNRPPKVMSPSILMDWGWVPCWAQEPGLIPISSTHVSWSHVWYLDGEVSQQHWWDEWASVVMMLTSRGTVDTRPLPLPLTPEDSERGIQRHLSIIFIMPSESMSL